MLLNVREILLWLFNHLVNQHFGFLNNRVFSIESNMTNYPLCKKKKCYVIDIMMMMRNDQNSVPFSVLPVLALSVLLLLSMPFVLIRLLLSLIVDVPLLLVCPATLNSVTNKSSSCALINTFDI